MCSYGRLLGWPSKTPDWLILFAFCCYWERTVRELGGRRLSGESFSRFNRYLSCSWKEVLKGKQGKN